MTENDALKMIEMSLDKLKAYKMIPEDTVFSESLTLLGPGSPLDSIGFVTFMTDIEERISFETDKEIYLGPTGEYVDDRISLIPDFIANCGMARVFAYLMQEDAVLTDEAIFSDVSITIKKALEKVHAINSEKSKIAKAAFEIALKQLI